MHASREPTPRCYIRRCQTRYSEPSLYLYGHIERGRERDEDRGICTRLYTRVGTYVLSITPAARTHAADALQRATHTEIYGRKCRWYSLMWPVVLSLSLSIRRETRGDRIIRALSEMDFIRAAQSRGDTRVNTQEGIF